MLATETVEPSTTPREGWPGSPGLWLVGYLGCFKSSRILACKVPASVVGVVAACRMSQAACVCSACGRSNKTYMISDDLFTAGGCIALSNSIEDGQRVNRVRESEGGTE